MSVIDASKAIEILEANDVIIHFLEPDYDRVFKMYITPPFKSKKQDKRKQLSTVGGWLGKAHVGEGYDAQYGWFIKVDGSKL